MSSEKGKIQGEFAELAKPLIKFLNDHFNTHVKTIIDSTQAELLSGEMSFYTEDYIRD